MAIALVIGYLESKIKTANKRSKLYRKHQQSWFCICLKRSGRIRRNDKYLTKIQLAFWRICWLKHLSPSSLISQPCQKSSCAFLRICGLSRESNSFQAFMKGPWDWMFLGTFKLHYYRNRICLLFALLSSKMIIFKVHCGNQGGGRWWWGRETISTSFENRNFISHWHFCSKSLSLWSNIYSNMCLFFLTVDIILCGEEKNDRRRT